MALTGTLFTGLSGLVVNQSELNVVGNNIANANTTAFKSSQAVFTPQFYVTDNPGSPVSSTSGGSNPTQEGLGAQVASIETNFTAGSLQATGVQSDLAIDGNGFFVVNSGSNGQLYTRDGNFQLNDANQLVDSAGDFVQGYGVNSNFQVQGGALQNLTIPLGTLTIAEATQNASLSGTLDAGGVVATTGTTLLSQAMTDPTDGTITAGSALTNLQNANGSTALFNVNDTLTVTGAQDGRTLPPQTFTVTATSTVGDLENFFNDALDINTTPANTLASGQVPGASIVPDASGVGQDLQIIGNIGAQNSISLTGASIVDSSGASPLSFQTAAASTGESAFTTIGAFDSLGNPITLNVNTVLTDASNSSGGTTWTFFVTSPNNVGPSGVLGSGTLTYNSSGQLVSTTGNTVTINRTGTGAAPTQQITLDFSQTGALASDTSNVANPTQDGSAVGTLKSYSIGTDGTITGSFSNGLSRTVGQVVLANFNNPNGLVNQGGSNYAAGSDSGSAILTTAGTQGTGVIRAGELESSNVDLSQEFINLIIASTGYSASSRVITTADQLLQDLLNSQR